MAYPWVEAQGGRRRRVAGSPHTAWREPGFAGDADHLDTPEFLGAARSLLTAARRRRTALMCAEALPVEGRPGAGRSRVAGAQDSRRLGVVLVTHESEPLRFSGWYLRPGVGCPAHRLRWGMRWGSCAPSMMSRSCW